MKRVLFPGLLLTAVLATNAEIPQLEVVNGTDNVMETKIRTPRKFLKSRAAVKGLINNKVKPARVAPAVQRTETDVLYENFSGWDGQTPTWVPDGWTVENKGATSRTNSWIPSERSYAAPVDGDYYFIAYSEYGSDDMNEWLISPSIDITEGLTLDFHLYLNPGSLFGNVNWDTWDFDGDPTIKADLEVLVKPEGSDWQKIYSYAETFLGQSFMDICASFDYVSFANIKKSLNDFKGKKVQLAFRYWGIDGDVTIVDAIRVGLPVLEPVYANPVESLYWGFDRDANWGSLGQGIAMYPVFQPLTWINMSTMSDATYKWKYSNPANGEYIYADTQDELTVTYVPDYTDERTMMNNFHYLPELTASAPFATDGTFKAKQNVLHAGGKPEITFTSGETMTVGLLPFDQSNDRTTYMTVDYEKYGDLNCPIFGHDAYTDQYLLEETYNGEEPEPGKFVRLEGIMNVIVPLDQPLVLNGVTVLGRGAVDADAEFTMSVYTLGADGVFDYPNVSPIATAKCKGSDFVEQDPGMVGGLSVPFDFESPVLIQKSENAAMYIFLLTGFNSDKVEYWVPLQSAYPHPDGICHGYLLKHLNVMRDGYSMSPIMRYESLDFGPCINAFAMNLNGEYPWLTTETASVAIPAAGETVSVPLGSYYDGSQLTVDAPAGIDATVEGRYNECVLKLTRNEAAGNGQGFVTVSGPGVKVGVGVGTSGIESISPEGTDATVTGIYDLSGRRVATSETSSGVFIVKYSDGTTRKVVL